MSLLASKPMKRAHHLLLTILLCSCTGPAGAGDGGEATHWGRPPFLDRSNPLVAHTFQIMETRAQRSEVRELQRDRGLRVCEEGENGTKWKDDCNRCWCEWGVTSCTVKYCRPPEESARLRAEAKRHSEEKAERYRKVREIQRAQGVRVCEEGEDGTFWMEDPYTCWCQSGYRYCSKSHGPPPARVRACEEGKDWTTWKEDPYTCWCEVGLRWCSKFGRRLPPTNQPEPEEETFTVEPREHRRSRCKEDEIGTSWRWGCNTCWCDGGFRVCSKADCRAAP
jgi:hypothetical protein